MTDVLFGNSEFEVGTVHPWRGSFKPDHSARKKFTPEISTSVFLETKNYEPLKKYSYLLSISKIYGNVKYV